MDTMNLLPVGGSDGGGALGGAGGGFAGAALGSMLLGRGGLLGGGVGNGIGGEGCVTPTQLTAALAGVTDAQQSTAILQTLGSIQGAIPLAEGQVQLALAGAVGEIRSHLGAVENGLVAGQAITNKNVSDAIAASLASQNNINMNVMTMGQANLVATKDSQYATAVAISNSTKEILAALNDQNTANLQRQLTVAESALLENRLVGRTRESEINITNTNTATAQQFQAQNQMQAQSQAIIQLGALVSNLCGDIQAVRATTSNVNFGTQAGVGQTTNATNNKVG